ncbi:MAG: hypothetical protein IJD79_01540 [Clostridia bacterium]|nr:hypothetical protein [Clostridia bacterium]
MITKNDLKLVERLEPLLDELSYEPDEDGTIPTDELDAKLAERGMLENYKKWDAFLLKNGFAFTYPTEQNLKLGALIYEKTTELAVDGAYGREVVIFRAYLTAKKVIFSYHSSKVSSHCLTHYRGEEKLRAYYEKKFYFINFYPELQKIEIHNIEDEIYFLTDGIGHLAFREADFARLATLLDYELNRRYPFCTVRDYETAEQEALLRTMTERIFMHFGFGEFGEDCILKTLIGCHYDEPRAACIERAKQLYDSLNEENGHLGRFLTGAISELEGMSDDDYYRKKDIFFDV